MRFRSYFFIRSRVSATRCARYGAEDMGQRLLLKFMCIENQIGSW